MSGRPRPPPTYDLEAEQALLGGLLIAPEEWAHVSEVFDPGAFYLAPHADIARVMLTRARAGAPIDVILLRGDLEDAGNKVAADLVFPLAKGLGTAGNALYYWQRIQALFERRTGGPVDELSTLAPAAYLQAEETAIEVGGQRVATGWPLVDRAIGGGLDVPSLNVLGAAPKSGKSTWAQMIAERHVERGGVAYCLDLENGRRRFLKRLLCRRACLGMREVAAALSGQGAFESRKDVGKWNAAKAWVRDELTRGLFVEFTPPRDFAARLAQLRARAGDRPLLVVVDSLQKLPMPLDDRRAGIDGWIRLFERLRHEYNAAILLISEIKRGTDGAYKPSESAFKESGGIEYAADLAMTLTRPAADEDDADAVSTLRVELARDCDEDPRGNIASYRPVFPYYGLEETPAEPVPAKKSTRSRRGEGTGGRASFDG